MQGLQGIPYPPVNTDTIIIFREPFPEIRYEPRKRFYIRAIMGNGPEQEIRIAARQQLRTIEQLLKEDRKILNAKVLCRKGKFEVLERSPQTDFLSILKGET